MKKFQKLTSTAVPLPIENVDTDQIIPSRFLKATTRAGFGENLFRDWRFNKDNQAKDFVLNDSRYSGSILIAGRNFGCGSSREHAAWAIYDYGFRVVISGFFADIFKGNALNNFLLPVQVSENYLKKLLKTCIKDPKTLITVDLVDQSVKMEGLAEKESFEIDEYKKMCLLNGYDDIDYLLSLRDKIEAYEKRSSAV